MPWPGRWLNWQRILVEVISRCNPVHDCSNPYPSSFLWPQFFAVDLVKFIMVKRVGIDAILKATLPSAEAAGWDDRQWVITQMAGYRQFYVMELAS